LAVVADDADSLAVLDLQLHVAGHVALGISDGHPLGPQGGALPYLRFGEAESHGRLVADDFD
jgi:hypothetical protein